MWFWLLSFLDRPEMEEARKSWNLDSRLDTEARASEAQRLSKAAEEAKNALGYCKEGGCWLSRPSYFMLLRANAPSAFNYVTNGDDVFGTKLCDSHSHHHDAKLQNCV